MTDEQLHVSKKRCRQKCTQKYTMHNDANVPKDLALCHCSVCAEKHLCVLAQRRVLMPAWTSFSTFTPLPGSSGTDRWKSSMDSKVNIKSRTPSYAQARGAGGLRSLLLPALCILCYVLFLSCSFLASSPRQQCRKYKSLSKDEAGEVP